MICMSRVSEEATHHADLRVEQPLGAAEIVVDNATNTCAETSTVYIVDYDDRSRELIREVLVRNGFVVREYSSFGSFLGDDWSNVDCLVVDFYKQGLTALEVPAAIHRHDIQIPIVIVTEHGDVRLAVQVMKAGVVDFIKKPFDCEAMAAAVQQATRIGRQNCETATKRAAAKALVACLTRRQRQVLDLLVSGETNKGAAAKLGISPRTVEVYRSQIKAKFKLRSMFQVIETAVLGAFALPSNCR